MYNKDSGVAIWLHKNHTNACNDIKQLPNNLIISSSSDCTLKLTDPTTGQVVNSITMTFTLGIIEVISSNQVAVASLSTPFNINIVNLNTGTLAFKLVSHTSTIFALKLLSTGELLSGGGDLSAMIRMLDLNTGLNIRNFTGHSNIIRSIIELSNGCIASSVSNGIIYMWNKTTGQRVRNITRTGFGSNLVGMTQIYPNIIAFGLTHANSSLEIWNMTSGLQLNIVKNYNFNNAILFLKLLADGSILTYLANFNYVKIWSKLKFFF